MYPTNLNPFIEIGETHNRLLGIMLRYVDRGLTFEEQLAVIYPHIEKEIEYDVRFDEFCQFARVLNLHIRRPNTLKLTDVSPHFLEHYEALMDLLKDAGRIRELRGSVDSVFDHFDRQLVHSKLVPNELNLLLIASSIARASERFWSGNDESQSPQYSVAPTSGGWRIGAADVEAGVITGTAMFVTPFVEAVIVGTAPTGVGFIGVGVGIAVGAALGSLWEMVIVSEEIDERDRPVPGPRDEPRDEEPPVGV